jgi:NTE family protein
MMSAMTTAFVLWGGGSLGAVQVGALRALTEHGIRADLVAGASIGALNGVYYAARPTGEGVEELAQLWLAVGRHDVYPLSGVEILRALTDNLPRHPVRGVLEALGVSNYTFPIDLAGIIATALGRRSYLFPNEHLTTFLRRALPVTDLAETRIPMTVLAADLRDGTAVPITRGSALAALLASSAIPALYPPVQLDGRYLVDGEVADRTTLDEAVNAGADEIYLLNPGSPCSMPEPPGSALAMALHGYNLLAGGRMTAAIERIEHGNQVRVHTLPTLCPLEVLPVDFGQTAELIERATRSARRWLEHGEITDPARDRLLGHPH